MKKILLIILFVFCFTSTYVMPLYGATITTTNRLIDVKRLYYKAITEQFHERINYQKYRIGYVETTLNIRNSPNNKSKVVGTLYYGDKVKNGFTYERIFEYIPSSNGFLQQLFYIHNNPFYMDEQIKTMVNKIPIPKAASTVLVVAKAGQVPRMDTKRGFSLMIPLRKFFFV